MPLSRHLKKLVPKETRHLAKSKTAKDVIPSLWTNSSTSAATASAEPSFALHPDVLQYLHQQQQQQQGDEVIPAKLSSRQLRILQSLLPAVSAAASAEGKQEEADDATCKVRRAVLESAPHALTHLLAIASLQLRQLHIAAPPSSTNVTAQTLFVLVEDEANAKEMKRVCESLYGMQVLLLNEADKFPQFTPSSSATPSAASTQQDDSAKSKKTNKKGETSAKAANPLAGTSIIISTVKSFLTTDKRSAIWKYVYAFVVALLPAAQNKPKQKEALEDTYGLLSTIKGSTTSTASESVYKQLVHHRWDCLGHCTLALVLATTTTAATSQQKDSKAITALLYHPLLQFINSTAMEPQVTSPAVATAAANTNKEKANAEESKGTATTTSVPTVFYHALEGKDRLLFLFALIKNLQKGKGLVVHVATKEMCYFVYNMIFYFLYHSPSGAPGSATSNDYGLPDYVRLLSDYEGEGSFSFSVREEEDKRRLVREFDGIIDAYHSAAANNTTSRKKEVSAVLISCHALVPARGSIFIQYDCIPNINRFNSFVRQRLSSLLADNTNRSSGSEGAETQELCYAVRKRGRSTSPTPNTRSHAEKKTSETEPEAVHGGAHYPFIFLLTRPHETKPLLEILTGGPAAAAVTYKPLSSPPSLQGQFFFLGEDIVEANKQVFLLHNGAFNAYRNTMRVYCTLPPYKQLYESLVEGGQAKKGTAELSDKELVAQFQKNYRKFDWVQKIAEEFGFTEMPLLDLRVKKNEFRPREDLYGAARKVARIEARKYNAFAKEHILPEVDSD